MTGKLSIYLPSTVIFQGKLSIYLPGTAIFQGKGGNSGIKGISFESERSKVQIPVGARLGSVLTRPVGEPPAS